MRNVGSEVRKLAKATGTEVWMVRMLGMEWVKHTTGLKGCSLERVIHKEVSRCCKQQTAGIQGWSSHKLECQGWWVGVRLGDRVARSVGTSARRISGLVRRSLVKGWVMVWAEVSARGLLLPGKTVAGKVPGF